MEPVPDHSCMRTLNLQSTGQRGVVHGAASNNHNTSDTTNPAPPPPAYPWSPLAYPPYMAAAAMYRMSSMQAPSMEPGAQWDPPSPLMGSPVSTPTGEVCGQKGPCLLEGVARARDTRASRAVQCGALCAARLPLAPSAPAAPTAGDGAVHPPMG